MPLTSHAVAPVDDLSTPASSFSNLDQFIAELDALSAVSTSAPLTPLSSSASSPCLISPSLDFIPNLPVIPEMALPQRPGQRSTAGTITHPPSLYPQGEYPPQSQPYSSSILDDYRQNSYDQYPPQQPYTAPPGHHSFDQSVQISPKQSGSKGGKKRSRPSKGEAASPPASVKSSKADNKDLPAVLVREKKQKACANCRRAKLKCIVEDGESDCVRCQARKEKCVFYPRNHDEDWQQTLTQDLYHSIHHLANLSQAVHHILYHLTANGTIPAYEGPDRRGLEQFQVPDRDLMTLQGWGAERNKELGEPLEKRKKKGKGNQNDAFTEDGRSMSHTNSNEQYGEYKPLPPPPPQTSMARGGSLSVDRLPPNGWEQQSHPIPLDSRYSNPELAPFRPQGHPGQVHLTPTSELDINPQGYARQMSSSPLVSMGSRSMLPPVPLGPSPGDQTVTPNSLPHSSPSIHYSDVRNPSRNAARSESYSIDPNLANAEPMGYVVPPDVLLGSADPRDDAITKAILPPRDAVVLVNYSHHRLGGFLFGYRLEFGHFPYLPEGPTTITPLILSVLCLLASERIPEMFKYHQGIADWVRKLLLESPAESWQTIPTAEEAAVDVHAVGDDGSEDRLDPELAIGPEEIVAAAILSMWISERDKACEIASVAFKWARGWIKLLSGPPRNSIAELTGIVPEERKASMSEMSRVWLLCFVAEGTALIVEPPTRFAEPARDPSEHCINLNTGSTNIDPHDIILVTHARLLYLFRQCQTETGQVLLTTTTLDNDSQRAMQVLAITEKYDIMFKDLLDKVRSLIPENWTSARELELFGLFARATIHSRVTDMMVLAPRKKASSLATKVDVGMSMLEKCARWEPLGEITNMPQQYLSMITVVAKIITDAVIGSSRSTSGCSVTAGELAPLLDHLADALSSGGLPELHKARVCAASCKRMADELKRLM